jgi:probable addiction module antidote protein
MTKETFTRFDVVDHLKTEQDIALYLEAVLEDGDAATIALALGDVARARNMSQLARDTNITRQGLLKALSKDGNPSLDTVLKVTRALGLQLTFKPAKPVTASPRARATAPRAAAKAPRRRAAPRA